MFIRSGKCGSFYKKHNYSSIMDWFEKQVKKLHDRERKSFEKEQLNKLETDYTWIGQQGYHQLHDWDKAQNLAFVKMVLIVFVVIVGLIVWAVLA